jgi:hypothetical protein
MSAPATRIRARLKRNRKNRKTHPKGLLEAFLLVSKPYSFEAKLFHEPVRSLAHSAPRDAANNVPYPINSTSTLCGMTPAS